MKSSCFHFKLHENVLHYICHAEVAKLKQELQLKATEQFILKRRHSDNLVDVERLREVRNWGI